MGLVNDTKINQILSLSYSKGLLFSNWLEGQGYSNQLLRKYRNSGWLEPLCRGVMYREKLPLKGMIALACFNEQLNKDYRVAAHSALELAGFSHYVPMGKPLLVMFNVCLYSMCVPPSMIYFEMNNKKRLCLLIRDKGALKPLRYHSFCRPQATARSHR